MAAKNTKSKKLESKQNNAALLTNNGSGKAELHIHGGHFKIEAPKYDRSPDGDRTGTETKSENHGHARRHSPTFSIEVSDDKLEVVNQYSWRNTSTKIAKNFKHCNLREPEYEVYPKIKRAQGFFKGEYRKVEDRKISFKKKWLLGGIEKVIHQNQYQKDNESVKSAQLEGTEEITVQSLLQSFSLDEKLEITDKRPVTAIIGSVGSGKTTLLRRMARKTMEENGLIEENSFRPFPDSQVFLVYYMDLTDKQVEKAITPAQFLFQGLFKDRDEIFIAYQQLIRYQSRSVLYFDALDQISWKITKKDCRVIRRHDWSDSATILGNILSRSLLPHAKIVIASREFKVSSLPVIAQPEDILTLDGYRFEDAENIFNSLIGSSSQESRIKFRKFSKPLLKFLSMPIFLTLAAVVTTGHPEKLPPRTKTELFTRILLHLGLADNISEGNRIFKVIEKLKCISYELMKEGRIIFEKADLKKHDLKVGELMDLLIKVPEDINSGQCSRRVMFCDDMILEFLTAIYIAEMKLEKFNDVMCNELHKDRWSMVRGFICGIVYEKAPNQLYNVSKRIQKQKIVHQQLTSKFHSLKGEQLINVMMAIYETNDENIIRSCAKKMNLGGALFNPNRVHLLSSFMSRAENIDEVNLEQCGLDNELLEIIVEDLNDKKVQIKVLNMAKNTFTMSGVNFLLNNVIVDKLLVSEIASLESQFAKLLNVKCVVLIMDDSPNHITITNSGESLEVESVYFSGSLQIKDGIFHIVSKENTYAISKIISSIKFLYPTETHFQGKQNIKGGELKKLETFDLQLSIPQIFLDCKKQHSLQSSLITETVRRHKVKELDIEVEDLNQYHQFLKLKDEVSQLECGLNVRMWFLINKPADMLNLISRSIQIQNMHLKIMYRDSSMDVQSGLESCQPNRITFEFPSWCRNQLNMAKVHRTGTEISFSFWQHLPESSSPPFSPFDKFSFFRLR